MPGFLQAYGLYAVPALPVFCMAGWALLWALDPASRERDMVETVRAATQSALLTRIEKAAESIDISEAVDEAAQEAARALVGETLGRAPRRPSLPYGYRYNAEAPDLPELAEDEAQIVAGAVPRKSARNGRRPDSKN
jgi:hypothetical protein